MIKKVLLKGDYVSAKTWNGNEIIGILEYTYTDGEHCVIDAVTGKKFCCHREDVKLASELEQARIKRIQTEKKFLVGRTYLPTKPEKEEEKNIKLLMKENNVMVRKPMTRTTLVINTEYENELEEALAAR